MDADANKADKPLVRGITPSGFRISGQIYDRPILLYGNHIFDWSTAQLDSADGLLGLAQLHPRPELLVIGTGAQMRPVGTALRQALKAQAIVVEAMESRSAARTYNILVMEGRFVAAALLPPDR